MKIPDIDLSVGEIFIDMRFSDGGVAFDPLAEEEPEFTDEPLIGGLGIHLVKNLMDKVEYDRADDQNHLRVICSWIV